MNIETFPSAVDCRADVETEPFGVRPAPALLDDGRPFHARFGRGSRARTGATGAAILALVGVTVVGVAPAAEPEVPYPAGYRAWHHVKSMVIEEGHPLHDAFGGIHHIYANDRALDGYRGERFPDGAVIVFDLLEAVHDGHAVTEGARKVVGVMHKDGGRFAATGGWGFEGFGAGDPDRRVVGGNAAAACFGCHLPQAGRDYTFSRLRD